MVFVTLGKIMTYQPEENEQFGQKKDLLRGKGLMIQIPTLSNYLKYNLYIIFLLIILTVSYYLSSI